MPLALDDAQQSVAPTEPSFLVVGLGASAGGISALCTFFDHMPADSGMAFVVILHLAPHAESNLAAVLQHHTAIPVRQVTESVQLAINQIYVIPPNKHLVLADNMLLLTEVDLEQYRQAPIDHFFRTLADAHGSSAAAIILSGSGSDGSVGIKRIKEAGGVTLAQDPAEAEFSSMPRTAIDNGLVDFVLPVATMPDRLIAFWQREAQIELPAEAVEQPDADVQALREIFTMLRLHMGHDFTDYKRATIYRRLGRRLQVTGATDLRAYVALLHNQPNEIQALLQDLLISVTNFFRDPDAWTAVEAIIPQIFAHKVPAEQVRVWVAACATGEEAYSIAMLLEEYAATLTHPPTIQVFATDIDDASIAIARQGIYPTAIAGDITPLRLQRFFTMDHGRYRIKQDLRDHVLFARHNVLHDPPFSRVDLITCRNLLIYLNHAAQERVMRTFHFGMHPAGYLLLGSSESVDGSANLFTTVDKAQRLFQRRAGSLPEAPTLPSVIVPAPARSQRVPMQRERVEPVNSFSELHQQLVLPYRPPSVIINQDGDIVHLGRGIGSFLHFGEGEPSHNLLKVIRPELRIDLRAALFTVRQPGQATQVRRVYMTVDGVMRIVDVIVQPIVAPEWARDHLLVLFYDRPEVNEVAVPPPATTDTLVRQIEAELERTTFQLRTTVEQYEAAVEEHKATNEELQAINEELRAASEELETSKEELQSINEELTTLNQELNHKVDEVTRAHSDLQNLIVSTQIGTIFLDRALHIKRYTPSVQEIFNLIPADLNRPLAHVTHTLVYDRITEDAAEVIQTHGAVTREVQSKRGQWYLMRLHPYRTVEDRIDGVVVTFVDLTERKQAEERLRESEARFRAVADLVPDLLWSNDPHGGTEWYNQRWFEYTGQTLDQARDHGWIDVLHPDDQAGALENFQTALATGQPLRHEYRIRARNGAYRWFLVQEQPVSDPVGDITCWYGAATDIQEERIALEEAQAALRIRDQFLAIASHELRTPLTALMGYAGMLEGVAMKGQTTPQKMTHMINRQAHRLNQLIDRLLDVSRLQHGRFVIEQRPVDLVALAVQVVDEIRDTLPQSSNHTLELRAPDEPVLIVGDAQRLEQVFQNLLSNAVKYSPKGEPVQVRIGRSATEAVVEVVDRGIGIPAEAHAHLFELFYRARNVGSQASGFGLGLHIVREIVEQHGGRIEVTSTEGAGSTFRVVLPLPDGIAAKMS